MYNINTDAELLQVNMATISSKTGNTLETDNQCIKTTHKYYQSVYKLNHFIIKGLTSQ